jgi:hypothetical protein
LSVTVKAGEIYRVAKGGREGTTSKEKERWFFLYRGRSGAEVKG